MIQLSTVTKMSLGATPQEVAKAQVNRITHGHGYLDEYVCK